MKSKKFLTIPALLIGGLFFLSGCFGGRSGDSGAPLQVYETTSVGVAVGGGSGALDFNALFVGTFSDVASVTMEVAGEDKFGVVQNPLATATLAPDAGGVWRATIAAFPLAQR